MSKFAKRWREELAKTSLYTNIKKAVRPPTALKPRLNLAIRHINSQIQKLNIACERFSKRDELLFTRIVKAYSKRDMTRAKVLANELAEMRKMESVIAHAQLALEQVVLRLRTVSDLGDVVTTLGPAANVLQSVRKGMAGILPDAERELGQIGDLLSEIIMDSGQSTGFNINLEAANEDAQKILNEAANLAEQKLKEKLPKLPVDVPPVKEKAAT